MRKFHVTFAALLPSLAFGGAAEDYTSLCASCHGATGVGDGVAAAALDPKPASFADPAFWESRDDAHIKKVIKEGGPAVGKSPMMAALGASWDDARLDEMVAYLKTMKQQ